MPDTPFTSFFSLPLGSSKGFFGNARKYHVPLWQSLPAGPTIVTETQVGEFLVELVEVYKEFAATGPATAGLQTGTDGGELTLEEGRELMKRYFVLNRFNSIELYLGC